MTKTIKNDIVAMAISLNVIKNFEINKGSNLLKVINVFRSLEVAKRVIEEVC